MGWVAGMQEYNLLHVQTRGHLCLMSSAFCLISYNSLCLVSALPDTDPLCSASIAFKLSRDQQSRHGLNHPSFASRWKGSEWSSCSL